MSTVSDGFISPLKQINFSKLKLKKENEPFLVNKNSTLQLEMLQLPYNQGLVGGKIWNSKRSTLRKAETVMQRKHILFSSERVLRVAAGTRSDSEDSVTGLEYSKIQLTSNLRCKIERTNRQDILSGPK